MHLGKNVIAASRESLFNARIKKVNWAFRFFHAKRAKWGYPFSKFVKHFVKI